MTTELSIPSGDMEGSDFNDTCDAGIGNEKKKRACNRNTILLCLLFVVAITVGIKFGTREENSIYPDDDSMIPDLTDDSQASTTDYSDPMSCLQKIDETFNVTLPMFSGNVTEGYTTLDDFKKDLKEVGKYLLNVAIACDADDFIYQSDFGLSEALDGDAENDDESGNPSGANAYETNNQEFTMERADLVKSDGEFLFAADGENLFVLGIDGQGVVFKTELPPVNVTSMQTPNIRALFVDMNRLTVVHFWIW